MEIIGQGGVWKIYNTEMNNYVFRIPKYSPKASIEKFLENFKVIKKAGFATLSFIKKYEINGIAGLLCENVNYSEDRIYVSYNSLYSNSQKYLYSLSKNFVNTEERQSSQAEDFRYKNKIHQLLGFAEFINSVKSDLILAAKQNILIEFDAYFFGTEKQTLISTIDYKIVDLDHIFKNTDYSEDQLIKLNMDEFSRAINGFLKYFVTEKNRQEYLEHINE